MKIKTTAVLWTVGIVTGSLALLLLVATVTAILAADAGSSPIYSMIAAMIVCLGCTSTTAMIAATVLGVWRRDEQALAEVVEIERRWGRSPGTFVRSV